MFYHVDFYHRYFIIGIFLCDILFYTLYYTLYYALHYILYCIDFYGTDFVLSILLYALFVQTIVWI